MAKSMDAKKSTKKDPLTQKKEKDYQMEPLLLK